MPRIKFFHVFYKTTFTLLSLLTFVLILVPPGDAIAQAIPHSRRLYNVFVIGGMYILTGVVAVVLYTSRMYTFRRLLNEIPKSRVPISKADLPKRVHMAVTENLCRSARIAVGSRPSASEGFWGVVNHSGWAPPDGEMAGVEYRGIVNELPALLERGAKAAVVFGGGDGEVVTRMEFMTLRQWMENLVGMGLVQREEAEEFLTLYERARFRRRGKGIGEGEFRGLMRALKVVLDGMQGDNHGLQEEADWHRESGDEYTASASGSRRVDSTYQRLEDVYYGLGVYERSSSTDGYQDVESDGYTPERLQSLDVSTPPRPGGMGWRVRSDDTVIVAPRGKGRPLTRNNAGGSSSIGSRESIELRGIIPMSSAGRRRLSLRSSTGTFG
jgi:hypothetical protein